MEQELAPPDQHQVARLSYQASDTRAPLSAFMRLVKPSFVGKKLQQRQVAGATLSGVPLQLAVPCKHATFTSVVVRKFTDRHMQHVLESGHTRSYSSMNPCQHSGNDFLCAAFCD